MIEVRCEHAWADCTAKGLDRAINALNLASAQPDAFSTFEFMVNFAAQGVSPALPGRLWLLTVWQDGATLIAYLPLRRVHRHWLGLPYAELVTLVQDHADRPHLVVTQDAALAKGAAAAIWGYLWRHRRNWSALAFHQQDAASLLFPPVQQDAGTALHGVRLRTWPTLENCTIELHWASLPAYLAALNHKFRVNLRRQMRLLNAAGHLELLRASEPHQLPCLFRLYQQIEAHSWKTQAHIHIGHDARQVAYYEGLFALGAAWPVTIEVLLLDGAPIGGLISTRCADQIYALEIVYDGQHSRLAPGSAMLLLAIGHAINAGCRKLNLMSGSGHYKAHWLAHTTPTWVGQVYRVWSLPFARRLMGDGVRRMKGWMQGVTSGVVTPAGRFNPLRRALPPQLRVVTEDGGASLAGGAGGAGGVGESGGAGRGPVPGLRVDHEDQRTADLAEARACLCSLDLGMALGLDGDLR